MHKSKLFTILILTLLMPLTIALTPSYLSERYNDGNDFSVELADEDPLKPVVEASPEGYRKFNSYLDDLQYQISRISDERSRIEYLHTRLNEIEKERRVWDRGHVHDEISMDLIIGVLREIPSAELFHSENCEKYHRRIILNYDPTTAYNKEPKEPSVNKAFKLFKKICPEKSVEI